MGDTFLKFEAKLSGVKPVMAKKDQYTGRVTGGRIELTLSISQPESPEIPYEWRNRTRPDRWAPAPSAGTVAHIKEPEKAKAELEKATNRYTTQKAQYDRARERYGAQAVAYAQLAGLSVALGNQVLLVTMEPTGDSGMLPGFGAQLLPTPAEPETDEDNGPPERTWGDEDFDPDGEHLDDEDDD